MDQTEAEDIKKTWQEYTEELYKKKIFMIQITMMVCDHSPRARNPGMPSQLDLTKHHYEQS